MVLKCKRRDGVSREVPCSALKGETDPDSLPATPKSPPTRRVPSRAEMPPESQVQGCAQMPPLSAGSRPQAVCSWARLGVQAFSFST